MTISVFFAKNAYFLRHIEVKEGPEMRSMMQDPQDLRYPDMGPVPAYARRVGSPRMASLQQATPPMSMAEIAAAEVRAGLEPGAFQQFIDEAVAADAEDAAAVAAAEAGISPESLAAIAESKAAIGRAKTHLAQPPPEFFSQAMQHEFGIRDATGAIRMKTRVPVVSTVLKDDAGRLMKELAEALEKQESVDTVNQPVAYMGNDPLDLCEEKIFIDRLADGFVVRHHKPVAKRRAKQEGDDWSPETDNQPPAWIMAVLGPLSEQINRSKPSVYGYKNAADVVGHVRRTCN